MKYQWNKKIIINKKKFQKCTTNEKAPVVTADLNLVLNKKVLSECVNESND